MRIDNLHQYSTHRLVFPLTVNGLPVNSLINAKFEISDSQGVLVSINMEHNPSEVYFSESTLSIILTSINTIGLTGNYTYEVWVKLADDNPYIVRSGAIQFNKTKVRF
ncbi:hypothetical protein [Alishewanella phage vB_AspM_Slicko01]|nr:hypothetical protein [Alishewanella phage vB_AspM_Slicko01]